MKILILCTGNSCRSQMAHGFLQSFAPSWTIESAGTEPSGKINEKAMEVMKDAGIDISYHTPNNVNKYLNDVWDYVITVCDDANETCPIFEGRVKNKLHIGFDDPSKTLGTLDEINSDFIRVRDQIRKAFYELYIKIKQDEQQR